MSNIDKRAQKELYAKVEQQANSLRGNPREYQTVTGMCPVNVIEMQAQKIQALLDDLETAEKRNAEMEARKVELPPVSDAQDWLISVEVYEAEKVHLALSAAGIGIKGDDA